ncbi:N-acetyltransferase family protein, partial [Escherichia coli]|uniref:GNAT family N-acetyltransferase n=1 Tax=Escherichia coli TaxID=562 RepID=UPI003D9C92AB
MRFVLNWRDNERFTPLPAPAAMPSAMPIDASGSVRESGAVAIRPAIEADLPTIVGIYAHHVRTGTASFEIDAPD